MIPEINLLPKLEKRKTSPLLIYIILAIILIILAFMAYLFFDARAALKDVSAEERRLVERQEQLQNDIATKQSQNTGSLKQSVQYVQSVAYPVTPLIDETNALLPSPSYLRSYSFGTNQVTIEADFETMTAISKYVERLLASPYFTDAQIGSITNFDIELGEQDKDLSAEEKFKQMPRYSVTITATIDFMYLVGGRSS